MIGTLPTGARGFDCDWPVSYATALKFRAKGYSFALRYVNRRPGPITGELTPSELANLLRAGIAVAVVQHVALPGWHPTGALGRDYGEVAADEAGIGGLAHGCTVWCDLEEIAKGTDTRDVIAYCNNWYDAVKAAGYDPGLYVGYGAGLSAYELYWRLKMRRFWAAYNLSRDDYPAVRGVQLRQFAAKAADHVPGVSFADLPFDVNVAGKDALGSSPVFMLPPPLA